MPATNGVFIYLQGTDAKGIDVGRGLHSASCGKLRCSVMQALGFLANFSLDVLVDGIRGNCTTNTTLKHATQSMYSIVIVSILYMLSCETLY